MAEHWIEQWIILLQSEMPYLTHTAIAYVALSAVEFAIPVQRRHSWRGRARNIVYLALFFFLGYLALAYWYTVSPIVLATASSSSGFVDTAWRAAAFLLAIDFLYYWYHRAQHKFGALWALHELHHAEAELNVTTSFRTYWLESPVQYLVIVLPVMLVLGTNDPQTAMTFFFVSRFLLHFSHCNFRLSLGVLSPLVLGPQVHRIHHSILPEHANHNFAGMLPILDVIFGTYYRPARNEYPPTGVESLASNEPVWRVLLRPLVLWRNGARGLIASARSD